MKNAVSIELNLLRNLTAGEKRAVDRAMRAYAAFVELPLA